MSIVLQPWHLLVVVMAGLINREQSAVIAYLRVENAVLREQLKCRGGRPRFTDDQRRRLAVKAKAGQRQRQHSAGVN
jgi:hypothetical protein